jgi:hypothetical protein
VGTLAAESNARSAGGTWPPGPARRLSTCSRTTMEDFESANAGTEDDEKIPTE